MPIYLSKNNSFLLGEVSELHKRYLTLKPDVFAEKEKSKIVNTLTYHSSKIERLTLSYGEAI